MEEKEFIVLKLGSIKNVDFYEEHSKIIDKYGFVDMAKFGKAKVEKDEIVDHTLYIKESDVDKGRIFKAYVEEMPISGEYYPAYYDKSKLNQAQWFRVSSMIEVGLENFCKEFVNRQGRDVLRLFRGMNPIVHIRKREDCE